MTFERETVLAGNLVLPFFNFVVRELNHRATVRADQMIVMIAIIKFKNCFATIKLASKQNTGLLKLGQNPVHRGQADINAIRDQETVYVLRT